MSLHAVKLKELCDVLPQVKVVELKVTWITKSYSPKGSDSVYPPPSTITQENLSRSVGLSTRPTHGTEVSYHKNDKHKPFSCSWSNVSLPDGFRVRRLGYYDHTQRQLGERALYVFPAKGDATRITCEGPEGAPVLPEDPVARKV